MSLCPAPADTGGFLAKIRRRICLQAGHDCGGDQQTEEAADCFLFDVVIDEHTAGGEALSRFLISPRFDHAVMILRCHSRG